MIYKEPGPHMQLVLSRMFTKHAFFTTLMSHLNVLRFTRDDSVVPTAGTTGSLIIINENFAEQYSVPEGTGLLVHEVMHGVLSHITQAMHCKEMGSGPGGYPYDDKLANVAMDLVMNALITEAGVDIPPNGLLDTINFPSTMTWDEAYIKLMKNAKHAPKMPSEAGDHSKWNEQPAIDDGGTPGADPDAERAAKTTHSQSKMERALKSAELTAGNLAKGLQRLVDKCTTPQVPWQDVIRSTVVATKGNSERTMARPRRKSVVFPPHIYMPASTGHRAGVVAAYGDTSGSVQDSDWTAYFGELGAIAEELNPEQFFIGSCDTVATDPVLAETPDDVRSYVPVGGGGTNMPAIFDKLEEHNIVPDTLVILTDGYTPFGVEPPYAVIWVMTTDVVAPYGRTVRIHI